VNDAQVAIKFDNALGFGTEIKTLRHTIQRIHNCRNRRQADATGSGTPVDGGGRKGEVYPGGLWGVAILPASFDK